MAFSTNDLKRMSAVSGLVFGFFLVMHLVSHYSLNLGYEKATNLMILLRTIYQNPFIEVLIFVALITHMYSNTLLYMRRSKLNSNAKGKKDDDDDNQQTKKDTIGGNTTGSLELTAHRITGYFLSISIFGHVAATRFGPILVMNVPSMYDYSFVGVHYDLLPLHFFPIYLCILGIAGGWHLIYGTRSALFTLFGSSVVGKPFPIQLKLLAMANHIAIIMAVIALGSYMKIIDISDKEEIRSDYSQKMGMAH